MSSNTSSDPDLHLRTATELEKEVASHFQAIARLRRHLNSLVPVNRLPLELLIEIFYLCQSQFECAFRVVLNLALRENKIERARHCKAVNIGKSI